MELGGFNLACVIDIEFLFVTQNVRKVFNTNKYY
jgi:hypothetical protein